MKIYVASSWRNSYQPAVVASLRTAGHEVYDFRNPASGNTGFHWSEIDPDWLNWTPGGFRRSLDHRLALRGFGLDFGAMKEAEACVCVTPCGPSAHLEAGYFVGAGKPLIFFIPERCEPDLMYKMANRVCITLAELIEQLRALKG